MNRVKFMNELEKRLKYLPKEDRDDAISYYTEYINDMNLEDSEDVEKKLGNPKEIAAAILADCTEKQLNDRESKKGVKSSALIVWLTIIIIFSLPITLPLAIMLFIVLLTIFLVALCVIVSGLVLLSGFIFTAGIGQKLMCLGEGLVVMSVGLILLIILIALTSLSIRLIIKLSKKKSKKEVGEA